MNELGSVPEAGVRLIVGLGNPGRDYAHSRHNVGFWCLNRLARHHGIAFGSRGRLAAVGEGALAGRPVILAKPRTFVNLSGRAVSHLLQRHRLAAACWWSATTWTCRWGASASGRKPRRASMRSIIDAIGQDPRRHRHRPAPVAAGTWETGPSSTTVADDGRPAPSGRNRRHRRRASSTSIEAWRRR
jgi:hypothetical protein